MGFKVGDKVRIKNYEKIIATKGKFVDEFGNISVQTFLEDEMLKYCGREFCVKRIDDDKHNYILEGAGCWSWLENWLEPFDSSVKVLNRVGYCDSLEEAEQQITKENIRNERLKELLQNILEFDTENCLNCSCDECDVEGPCFVISLHHMKDKIKQIVKEM